MAAPLKKGINYFPLEAEIIENSKFIRLKMKYGSRIMYFYLTLLSHLFETEGYYLNLNGEGKENLMLHLWEKCVKYDNGSLEDTEEMLDSLIASGIFDGGLIEKGILTSEHIQEIYYTATAKRKGCAADLSYWLLSLERMELLGKRSPIYAYFANPKVNDVNNSQSKVKENKEKENKEYEIIGNEKIIKNSTDDKPDSYYALYTPEQGYQELKSVLISSRQGECIKMLEWVNAVDYYIIHKYIKESGVKTIAQAEPFIKKLMEFNPCTMANYNALKKQDNALFYGK